MKQQIVLARMAEGYRPASGNIARHDLGERTKMERHDTPVAMMWIKKGSTADVAKAAIYAAAEGYTVFAFPATEKDPLTQAKTVLSKLASQ